MRALRNFLSGLSLAEKVALAVLLIVATVWLGLGVYQTHYQIALGLLGDNATKAVFGVAKEGRGDEWSTYIPILKQAYLEGFPAGSNLEPYRENLKWFLHIPRLDWSLAFLPNQLAYWVVPGPLALSMQGLYYNALFLLSMVWLLKNLGVRSVVAIPAAIMILFSQMYQVWWTSNFPALGASILPFAILTSSLNRLWKYPLLGYAIAHMLFGQMYPAFYYSLAIAVIPITLLVRTDLITLKDLVGTCIAAVAACALYLVYDLPYIEAVSGTTYPGMRVSTGGGSSWSTLLGAVLPTVPAKSAIDVGLTFYELSMAGTVLVVPALVALLSGPLDRQDKRLLIGGSVLIALLSAFAIYAFVPVDVARATGLSLVPGRRMQLGISIAVALVSCILVSRKLNQMWGIACLMALLIAGVAAHFLGVREDSVGQVSGLGYYFLLAATLCATGLVVDIIRKSPGQRGQVFSIAAPLWGMAIFHVLTYGTFNPLMRARDVLNPVRTQITRDWAELYAFNGRKPFAVDGNYGHLLRGEGLPAYEAIHLKNVDDDVYAHLFSDLSATEREKLFNQFRGIRFANRIDVDSSSLTASFPLLKHGVQIPIHASDDPAEDFVVSERVKVDVLRRRTVNEFEVLWTTHLASALPVNAKFRLASNCVVRDVRAVRYPVDASRDTGKVAARGVSGSTRLIAGSEAAAEKCAEQFTLHSPDLKGVSKPDSPVIADRAWRESAQWSGQACDLSGEARQLVSQGSLMRLQGYAIGPDQKTPSYLTIMLSSKSESFAIRASTGIERPDVAAYFHNPSLVGSGYEVALRTNDLPLGEYSVDYLMGETGSWFCETGKKLILRP